jgi:hypothetical protein
MTKLVLVHKQSLWLIDVVRPVCKGEDAAFAAKQADFYDQMTATFRTQFAAQSKVLGFLTDQMENVVKSPSGFGSPAEEAALRTDATQQNSQAFENASHTFQNRAFALGDRQTPSGATQLGLAQIGAEAAASQAGGQRQITELGAQLKRQNFFNAANVLSGVASLQNPAAYGGEAIQGGTSAFNSLHATQSHFVAQLLSGLAGGVAQAFIPGAGTGLAGLKGLFGGGSGSAGDGGVSANAGAPSYNPVTGDYES